jgi:hypothetical protein
MGLVSYGLSGCSLDSNSDLNSERIQNEEGLGGINEERLEESGGELGGIYTDEQNQRGGSTEYNQPQGGSLGGSQLMQPDSNETTPCVPDSEKWTTHQASLNQFCSSCHGESLQYGAPYSLTKYEDILIYRDPIIDELTQATMPPAGQPRLDTERRLELLNWLECGETLQGSLASPAGGFESSRPILGYSTDLPPNSDFFDLKAHSFHLGVDSNDHYECFTFTVPVDEERFITRIETLVDDARVLHHTVLIPNGGDREPGTHSRCDSDNPFNLIYGWAPGQGPLQFEEGGILLQPGQEVTLQIHYNNRAGHEDVHDQSGVRIYHSPPNGPEVTVLTMGPLEFKIPPQSRGEAVGYCEIPQDAQLIASFPHMHEQGLSFKQEIYRLQEGSLLDESEDIIELSGWDFNSQYVYESPLDLHQGDLVKTTCIFENQYDRPLRFGEKTRDEMCFNFAYISPPMSISLCNQKDPPLGTYEPGMCASPEFETLTPPNLDIPLKNLEPFNFEGQGTLMNGIYEIVGADLFVKGSLGGFMIDFEQSRVQARGLFEWQDQTARLDLNSEIRLVASGLSFTRIFPISIAGQVGDAYEEPLDLPDSDLPDSDLPDSDLPDSDLPDSDLPDSENLDGRLSFTVDCGDAETPWLWIPPNDPLQEEFDLIFPIPFGFVDLVIQLKLRPLPSDLMSSDPEQP